MTRSILAAGFVAALAGAAAADCPKRDAAAPVKVHVVRDAGGTRVVIDTPIDVCGRPPAPQVAYLAPPLHIDYAWEDVALDFLPLIIRTVEGRAFDGAHAKRPAASWEGAPSGQDPMGEGPATAPLQGVQP